MTNQFQNAGGGYLKGGSPSKRRNFTTDTSVEEGEAYPRPLDIPPVGISLANDNQIAQATLTVTDKSGLESDIVVFAGNEMWRGFFKDIIRKANTTMGVKFVIHYP